LLIISIQVVIYDIEVGSLGKVELRNIASYRTSTAPIDLAVSGNMIAVADLMKSISVVEYSDSSMSSMTDGMKEVARHFQTVWTTAVVDIAENTYLVSDAEGNLIVLRRNINGVTAEDQRRLEVTSEMLLGEMVNRIRPVNIPQTSSVVVTPKAFLGTVSSI
jgi:DNA damage-binding protein 1